MRSRPALGLGCMLLLARSGAGLAAPDEVRTVSVTDESRVETRPDQHYTVRVVDEQGDEARRWASRRGIPVTVEGELRDGWRIEVSSPVHEPCLVAPGEGASCRLRGRRPFSPSVAGEGTELWVRAAGAKGFSRLPPVPAEWGGGFAIPEGMRDLAILPRRACASLFTGLVAGPESDLPRPASNPTRPGALRARFLSTTGEPIGDRPAVTLVARGGISDPPSLEAWDALLSSLPLEQLKDGTLTVSAVPCEGGVIRVAFPGRQPVALAPRRPPTEGLIDIGVVNLPRLVPLTARVLVESDEGERDTDLVLRGRLLLGPEGTAMASSGREFEKPFDSTSSVVEVQLFPGEWRVELRRGGRTLGERVLLAREGDELDETFTMAILELAGRVERHDGSPVADVAVAAFYLTDGERAVDGTRTSEDGAFRLRFRHAGGPVNVVASPPDGGHQFVRVDPSSDDLERLRIRLGGAEFRVDVLHAITRKPVPGVMVVLKHSPRRPLALARTADRKPETVETFPRRETDDEGNAVFAQLEDGLVAIEYVGGETWLPDERTYGPAVELSKTYSEHAVTVTVTAGHSVSVRLSSGGIPAFPGEIVGPLSPGARNPRSYPVAANGEARVVVPEGPPSLFGAGASGKRARFFTVGPTKNEVGIELAPRRLASDLAVSSPAGPERVALVLSAGGSELPPEPVSRLLGLGGCSSLLLPSPPLPFDVCLEDGVYSISGALLPSGERTRIVPEVISVGGGPIHLTVLR